MKHPTSSGTLMLELALVVPLLLFIVFAALDIGHYYRAQTALQAGVDTALRCIYPLQGKCNQAGSNDLDLFDAYLKEEQDTRTGYRYRYLVNEEYISGPINEINSIEASVLQSVKFTAPLYQHRVKRAYYPAATKSVPAVVLAAAYPLVIGSAPGNARFVYRRTKDKTYPPAVSRSIGSSAAVSLARPSTAIGSTRFRLPAPPKGPCYVSTRFNHKTRHAPSRRSCSANKNGKRRGAFVILHIRGSNQGSEDGASAVLEARVNGRSLGGRLMTSSPGFRDGSLVPRGAPDAYVTGGLRGYSESSKHSPIWLEYRKEHSISLSLRHAAGGSFVWNGGSVKVYAPLYRKTTGKELECENGVPKSALADPSLCLTKQGPAKTRVVISDYTPLRFDAPIYVGQDATPQLAATKELLAKSSIEHKEDFVPAEPALIGELPYSSTCPKNFGAMDENEAAEICPPPPGAKNVSWDERTESVPIDPPIRFKQLHCGALPTIPSLPYRKYKAGAAEKTAEYMIPSKEPESAIRLNYPCESFLVKSKTYSGATHPKSALSRPMIDFGCDWKKRATEIAVLLGANPQTKLNAARTVAGTAPLGTAGDSCTASWIERTQSKGRYVGRFSRANLPEICKHEMCTLTPVTQLSGGSSAVDKEYAKQLAYQAVTAALPGITPNCSAKDCVEFFVDISKGRVTVQGRLKTRQLYLWKSQEIFLSAARTLEHEL